MFTVMKIYSKELGPVQTNCYVIIDQGHALVVDPGGYYAELDSLLAQNDATLDAILLTHAHFDHIEGLDDLVDTYHVPVYIHPAEADFLNDPTMNGSYAFMHPFTCKTKAEEWMPGKHTVGPFEIEMIHTPGHTVGSSIFIIEDKMFAGDTIFQGSIGRTDLPTGNMKEMRETLNMIRNMDTDYTIYCGHGPATTLNQEKQWNPYLR